jgi:hypothetical protein
VDDFGDRLESLLGQLELGLGVGFRRALRAPADEVCEMVLDCVDRDTRLDWHLDERADYYALLLLAAGVDVATVELLVAAHELTGDDPKDRSTLPLDVLVRMGVRGSRGAEDALGRYLAGGVDVASVLWLLQGDGERSSKIPAWRRRWRGSVRCCVSGSLRALSCARPWRRCERVSGLTPILHHGRSGQPAIR